MESARMPLGKPQLALSAVVLTTVATLALVQLSTEILESYVLGIFVATPLICGAPFVLSYNWQHEPVFGESIFIRTMMEPEPYWGWLRDELIHLIHKMVLNHIKHALETKASSVLSRSWIG